MILPLPCLFATRGSFYTHVTCIYIIWLTICVSILQGTKNELQENHLPNVPGIGWLPPKKNCMLKEKSEPPKAPLFISSLGASHLSIILSSPVWLFCCSEDYFGRSLWDAHSSKTTPFSGLSQGREIMLASSNAFIDSTSVQCWVLLFSNHGFKSKSPDKTNFSHENMK